MNRTQGTGGGSFSAATAVGSRLARLSEPGTLLTATAIALALGDNLSAAETTLVANFVDAIADGLFTLAAMRAVQQVEPGEGTDSITKHRRRP
jgi:hypothetical protein